MTAGAVSADLTQLAQHCGIATSYENHWGRHIPASAAGVRAALGALGVACGTEAEVRASLVAALERAWRQVLPRTVVARQGDAVEVPVHAGARTQPSVTLVLETGEERPLDAPRPTGEARAITGGVAPGERRSWLLTLPGDLPIGDHRLIGPAGAEASLIVAPRRCPQPERGWGWTLLLPATRSSASWGIGDLGDLGDLARWSGPAGADFLLVNPLHAATPGLPQEPSPYFPTSRRFVNPLYLRIEDIPEIGGLGPGDAARIGALAAACRTRNTVDRIERDPAYEAKMQALALLHAVRLPPARAAAFAAYRAEQGEALVGFATFCALAERHGQSWRSWPRPLRHPGSPAVEVARRELAGRVAFHTRLQWLADEQLAAVQRAAREAGMGIGVIADLAVGVSPEGADAWALQDDLALGVTVGAPPDDFNAQGQDWRLPPLLPNRLAQTAYAPFRQLVRSGLRHAGGIRVDHIFGLFRLWWIPDGAGPVQGVYVQYPADDLLGVLALEAHRAGAIVVGEDLGTAPPGVAHTLSDRGVLGSSVVWFERGWQGERARASWYREPALTSVTTHDLPTAAGFWSGQATQLKIELGLLGDGVPPHQERESDATARASLEALLRDECLIGDHPTLEELVLAVQRFAGRTQSRLVALALADAIADPRQPNLPGTLNEYPNWRLPVFDPKTGAPALLDTVLQDPRVHRLVSALREVRPQARIR